MENQMKAWQKYFEVINQVVKDIEDTQGEQIMAAAKLCADASEKGGLIYAFGCWHSLLVAEENYYRAASPANFVALAEASLNGTNEMTKLSSLESCYGIGASIIDYHRVDPNRDVFIAISNGGNNIVTNEAALRAKEKGIPVIAITSFEYSDTLNTAHNSGKKLKDIADVVIDNRCLMGDAAVAIEGFPFKVGPVSGIPMNYVLTAILVEMAEMLVERGVQPEIYFNAHIHNMSEEAKKAAGWLDNADSVDHNQKLIDKYFYRIKSL